MSENSIPDEALPLTAKQRIDRLCVAFEEAWIAGQDPRAEEYFQKVPQSEQAVLLRELLRLESHYRQQRGETFDLKEYRDRFAGYLQVVAEVLNPVADYPPSSPRDTEYETDQELDPESSRHGRFLPGAMLGNRYRVVGLLGRGGMGEVYQADDLKLGQALALKFVPKRLAGDDEVQALFRNEVRLARQIAHPNVCRVYDIGEADGHQFLSMEYVDGENLASLRRRIGRLPPDRALAIARQLVAGLAAAHERGILHRDLKPANVMLDGRGQVRITDYGLASLIEKTGSEQICAGTPLYMAPEQLAGEPVTVRSDLYALGLVLYELFTGHDAFEASSLGELLRIRREQTPVAPSRLVEGIDSAVERSIMRLLEPDPQSRPPSAPAVLAALPGGDPLQAAVAAGETPSPEMVAAARQPGHFPAGVGGFCLAGIIAALVAVAMLSDRTTLVGEAALKSPQSLTERARRIIEDHGHEEQPADWACGFRYEKDPFQIAQVSFWYRQSPTALVPQFFSGSITAKGNGTVSLEDPPPIAGEMSVRLDPRGELIELRAWPSPKSANLSAAADSTESAVPTRGYPSWCPALFREAGLVEKDTAEVNPATFVVIAPTWDVPIPCNRRMAWKGLHPKTKHPVRVEAASMDGRPVFFRVTLSNGEDRYPFRSMRSAAYGYVRITLFLVLMISAGLLARHNLRRGRGDRKGAFRLAYCVLIAGTLSWLLLAGRAANPPPWPVFVMGIQIAVFWVTTLWLFYMALEPWVRRLWPETLISWNRLIDGRICDPLVGRDLLIGVVFGILSKLLCQFGILAPSWLGLGSAKLLGPQRTYLGISLQPLLGGRYCLGELIHYVGTAVTDGIIILLLLLLLRFVLRKKELAGVAYVLYGSVAFSTGVGHPAVSWIFAGLGSALLVVLLMRFGLLALVSWAFVRLLLNFPITADLSAWHAGGTTLVPLGVVIALAVFGLYVSSAKPAPPDAISR